MPFEQQMVDDRQQVHRRPTTPPKRMEAMKQFQKTYTENVYGIGLTVSIRAR